ncbi:GPI mannosyltransferase 1 [Pestalotiopsis fici W106-1]|uniref:GPI mannosyltransferase 1 n=1 Tax=Pestalotiopsis fici (strain W106-1 / CGMCC3.15140) TaxID=1229662 RepID=W3X702_PESFW|nr:GPI mannosyltransferase 1 [Pestalotiopsis fici W106-1]ETS81799.1 GPI mannosyltransferase 1 [Pestalotiopsis fici W106-1]
MTNLISAFFSSPVLVFTAAFLLRAVLLVYGLWQDANSPLKYTDIDYLVFTDAARLTFAPPSLSSSASSPYARETYRYTPVLAWLLYPTTLPGALFFSSGKILFAAADLAAGWLLVRVLRRHAGLATGAALRYASIWLLNPMVATISTRGSSEGLLGVLVAALLCAVLERRVTLAALLLGLGVHFKIYPFIYAPAIVWWMDAERVPSSSAPSSAASFISRFITPARLRLALISLATFAALNLWMYALYGQDFLQHTFLHHVTRIDHRHNFSPYNILLYLASAQPHLVGGPSAATTTSVDFLGLKIESVAFLPQLLLSCVLIPLVGAKKDLPTTMLAQTFAFVTFNKVCTSQYFLWYMIFLPLYLPNSSLIQRPAFGITALALWIVTQGLWLQQGYNLEFLGQSTFVPGLFNASLGFFLVNCWILGIIIGDLDRPRPVAESSSTDGSK